MSLLFGIFSGCNYPKAKFGSNANSYRVKVGLQTISKEWQAISVGQNYSIWKNPLGDKLLKEGKPLFFSKSVKYGSKNELISEEDLYYSGKKFITIDGHESETVSVKYFFLPQELGDSLVKGWYCTYVGPPNETNSGLSVLPPVQISLKDADSILETWNLNPPIRNNK